MRYCLSPYPNFLILHSIFRRGGCFLVDPFASAKLFQPFLPSFFGSASNFPNCPPTIIESRFSQYPDFFPRACQILPFPSSLLMVSPTLAFAFPSMGWYPSVFFQVSPLDTFFFCVPFLPLSAPSPPRLAITLFHVPAGFISPYRLSSENPQNDALFFFTFPSPSLLNPVWRFSLATKFKVPPFFRIEV